MAEILKIDDLMVVSLETYGAHPEGNCDISRFRPVTIADIRNGVGKNIFPNGKMIENPVPEDYLEMLGDDYWLFYDIVRVTHDVGDRYTLTLFWVKADKRRGVESVKEKKKIVLDLNECYPQSQPF